jgi:hypothetical protein
MTEAEWLECGDPELMLAFLRGRASERKQRLFASACCRRIWHLMEDERSRNAVEVAERYAEGLVGVGKLRAAYELAYEAYMDDGIDGDSIEEVIARIAVNLTVVDIGEVATSATEAANAKAHVAVYGLGDSDVDTTKTTQAAYSAERFAERAVLCCYLRCIFGNPFQLISFDPSMLAWNGSAIRKMAQAIYDDRAFARLPLLADALEDAGCIDADVLSHCRTSGDHVRGCWVVDLLLGKS